MSTSCKGLYYQVYEVDSDSLILNSNSYVYENEDCKIMYNLWSNHGEAKFAFYNKTNKDIFINMKQTSLIINGQSHNYYQNKTYTYPSSVNKLSKSGIQYNRMNNGDIWGKSIYDSYDPITTNIKKGIAISATVKEDEIVCVPAKSYKVLNKNSINPILILTCNKAKDFPKTKYNVETYEQSSTPLTIVNRIAYGFDKENVSENYINNTFWVNSITNYSKKSATDNIKHKSCYSIFYTKCDEFVIGSPNKFYVTYKKSDYSVINDDMY